MEKKKVKMKNKIKFETPSLKEQETILDFDYYSKRWTIYSDVLKHVRRYKNNIDFSYDCTLGYNSKNELTMIKGTLKDDSLVTLSKKRKMRPLTQEQIENRRRNLKKAREALSLKR